MTQRQEAFQTISAIEKALKSGFRPPSKVKKGEPSALNKAAEYLNIPYKTIYTRISKGGMCEKFNLHVNWNSWTSPEEERTVLQLKRENEELKRRLTSLSQRSLDEESIVSIIKDAVNVPVNKPDWLLSSKVSNSVPQQEVPITIWSDWHCGEVISLSETNGINEFNSLILDQRVKNLVSRTIDICRHHSSGSYPGIVVNLLGDFVSGGIHPELLKTDEEEVIPSALRARDLLVWGLEQILTEFKQVYIPCTSGNHGRITQKPENKRYVYKNFDWLIYQLLARHFKDNENIVFEIPDSNEVLYKVYGQRYLSMHGDQLGVKGGDGIIGALGPIVRGEIKVGRQFSSVGKDYDTLLIGHWHQQIWLPRVIVSNTLKGFCQFAHTTLRAAPTTPSQPLWFVHPRWGKTKHFDIFLEESKLKEEPTWCQFQKMS